MKRIAYRFLAAIKPDRRGYQTRQLAATRPALRRDPARRCCSRRRTALEASCERHARRLLGRCPRPLSDRRHARKTRCTRPSAARAGRDLAERRQRAALAIHTAPWSEVPRRQRGVARRHRADSRRTSSCLDRACNGRFPGDRERNRHAFTRSPNSRCLAIFCSSAIRTAFLSAPAHSSSPSGSRGECSGLLQTKKAGRDVLS